jgi:hypothetical protein
MDLTTEQLHSVVVLGEHLHFGRAASALYWLLDEWGLDVERIIIGS